MTVVVIRSSKGGVGRTALTALLAPALSARGAAVTVMDLDRQDALRLYCGDMAPAPSAMEASQLETVVTAGGFSRVAQTAAGCALLMGGGPNAQRRAPGLLSRWLGGPEILLVDMPADEDAVAAAVCNLAGLHLRVFGPDLGALARLEDPDQDAVFNRSVFVLNQADRRRPLTESAAAFLRHVAGARYAGEIRRDEAVPESFAALQPLAEYESASGAWHDLEALAADLQMRCQHAMRQEAQALERDYGRPDAAAEPRRA